MHKYWRCISGRRNITACDDHPAATEWVTSLVVQVKTGARLVLFCMSDANPDPWIGPLRMTEQELREHFQVQFFTVSLKVLEPGTSITLSR